MEAATSSSPPASNRLAGDKAQRIVDAMRASVALRGSAGSTFDHVAREAGVSRGLLHYYFGTKERLLAEVVRRDCEIRMAVLDEAVAGARTADDFIDALVRNLEELIEHEPGFYTLLFELFTLAQRNEEIAGELAELGRRTRARVAASLKAKHDEGVLELNASPEAVATVLFALGDGLALTMLTQPDADFGEAVRAAIACARSLIV